MCGLASVSIWYVILKKESWSAGKWGSENWEKDYRELHYNRFISTLVILLYLVHPTITQFMIDMFNCMDFDGTSRLLKDPQIVCWEGLHGTYTNSIALVCMIVWGLGIPFLIFWLMSRMENLDTAAALQ